MAQNILENTGLAAQSNHTKFPCKIITDIQSFLYQLEALSQQYLAISDLVTPIVFNDTPSAPEAAGHVILRNVQDTSLPLVLWRCLECVVVNFSNIREIAILSSQKVEDFSMFIYILRIYVGTTLMCVILNNFVN